MTELERAADRVARARRLVFLGGAGVSTASGIPDFRSAQGIGQGLDFETLLSRSYFAAHPREFFDFYKSHMVYPQAQPNLVHRTLARWEREGRVRAILTQNIDGLHQKAGSEKVLELHGSVLRNHCTRCGKSYGLDAVMAAPGVPRCACGGIIKPDVVLYEEPLPQAVMEEAVDALMDADLLIVAGTSLRVYPAAGMVEYATHAAKLLFNREGTPLDGLFDQVILGDLAEIFRRIDPQD